MTQACRRRSPERGSGCRWDGEEPRTAPSREPQNPKTPVTLSSKPAEIRRVTPCPFRDIRITAVVALDCRAAPLDPPGNSRSGNALYAHGERCRGKGRGTCGPELGKWLDTVAKFGREAESRHRLDTR